MKKGNLMITLLIVGRKQLGNNIYVYLAPLIDDLQESIDLFKYFFFLTLLVKCFIYNGYILVYNALSLDI